MTPLLSSSWIWLNPRLKRSMVFSAKGKLIPYAEFRPFAGTSFDKNNITFPYVIPAAEQYLGKPVPNCPASVYMDFYRNGNRSRYEALYFARRTAMMNLLMAELTEKQGRFTDTLIDYIWAILEESTWVIPAHNHACHGNPPSNKEVTGVAAAYLYKLYSSYSLTLFTQITRFFRLFFLI